MGIINGYFLDQSTIVVDLKSTDKKSIITELVDVLKNTKKLMKPDEILNAVLEREKLGSTGIGQGVAIPHGKTNVLDGHIGVLGISRNGVEFNSLDGELVHIIFILVGPAEVAEQHLKALSRISKLFRSKLLRENIIKAKTAEEVAEIIEREEAC
ncbi:PTS sugar transporter subunit IIA [Endomicrobiia bacterium]|nr:PTS sugar transporter subunit IIA [Endomicrobiia bacterium]